MSLWLELSIILALTLLNGVFSGAELAMLSLRPARLRQMAEAGSASARAVLRLRENPERLLATIQVGVTVVSASTAVFGGARFEVPVTRALERLGLGEASEGVAFVLVVGGISYLTLVLGELVPKSLGLRNAERFALLSARALEAVAQGLRPVVWLLTRTSNLVLAPFHDATTFSEGRLGHEELKALLTEAADAGSLPPRAGELARASLDLGQRTVNALMVPRGAIVSLPAEASPEEVREVLRRRPHARYPVRAADSVDGFAGYVLARDLYEALADARPLAWGALLRPLAHFPATAGALEVLRALQAERRQLGIVVEESGGVAGLVTIEDIVEEVVGDIVEEQEVPRHGVLAQGDGAFTVRGELPLHEASQHLGLALPAPGGVTTVAGLVVACAGRIPAPGERFVVAPGLEAEVLEATARRVQRVRLRRVAAPE